MIRCQFACSMLLFGSFQPLVAAISTTTCHSEETIGAENKSGCADLFASTHAYMLPGDGCVLVFEAGLHRAAVHARFLFFPPNPAAAPQHSPGVHSTALPLTWCPATRSVVGGVWRLRISPRFGYLGGFQPSTEPHIRVGSPEVQKLKGAAVLSLM